MAIARLNVALESIRGKCGDLLFRLYGRKLRVGPLPDYSGHETLQLGIIAVIESLEQLKESAEYELCGIVEQRPGVLDELAAERTKLLEQESAELQQEAERLAEEIKELSGAEASRIG